MSTVRAWKAGKNSSCCFSLTIILWRQEKNNKVVNVWDPRSFKMDWEAHSCVAWRMKLMSFSKGGIKMNEYGRVSTCQYHPLSGESGRHQCVLWTTPVWPRGWPPQGEKLCCLKPQTRFIFKLPSFDFCCTESPSLILAEDHLVPAHLGDSSPCWSSLQVWCRPRSYAGTPHWARSRQTVSGSATPWSEGCIWWGSWTPAVKTTHFSTGDGALCTISAPLALFLLNKTTIIRL